VVQKRKGKKLRLSCETANRGEGPSGKKPERVTLGERGEEETPMYHSKG